MKKEYMKPSILVLKQKPTTMICTSPVPPFHYPGPFGYVPGQHGDGEQLMA